MIEGAAYGRGEYILVDVFVKSYNNIYITLYSHPVQGFVQGVCLECPSPRLVGEFAVRDIPIINTLRQKARNINKHISVGWEGWLMTLVSENCYVAQEFIVLVRII